MSDSFLEPVSCCGNCRHVFWLPKSSSYFGLGECCEQAKAQRQQGEFLVLVSVDYGAACPHFEATEDCLPQKNADELADFLGVKAGADFPGSL